MDTNEQALVEAEAAPLAAPSAAVAGLVTASIAENTKRTYAAALKRLDAALEGQDLTDASLAIYLASLHAAGLSPAVASMAVAVGIEGRVSGRCWHRGPGIRSQSPSWERPIPGSRRGLACRDADGGPVAVIGDAGPLCSGPAGSTGRRRSRPLRSRIKPGSTDR